METKSDAQLRVKMGQAIDSLFNQESKGVCELYNKNSDGDFKIFDKEAVRAGLDLIIIKENVLLFCFGDDLIRRLYIDFNRLRTLQIRNLDFQNVSIKFNERDNDIGSKAKEILLVHNKEKIDNNKSLILLNVLYDSLEKWISMKFDYPIRPTTMNRIFSISHDTKTFEKIMNEF